MLKLIGWIVAIILGFIGLVLAIFKGMDWFHEFMEYLSYKAEKLKERKKDG